MSAIEDLKRKTDGMPDEVVLTITTQQAKALLEQLEAERQRADAAESYARERDSENESIAITVGRLRTELSALRGTQEPIYQVETTVEKDEAGELISIDWRDVPKEVAERAFEEYELLVRKVFTHPAKPVVMQEKVKPFEEVVPNDVVPVGNEWFRVRYITRHGNNTSLHLQRENEKLHPLRQNDVIHLSVDNSVPLMIVVKDEENPQCKKCGGRGAYHCPQMRGTVECECGIVVKDGE